MLSRLKNNRQCRLVGIIAVAAAVLITCSSLASDSTVKPIPFVKQWSATAGSLPFTGVQIVDVEPALSREVVLLKDLLAERGIAINDKGVPLYLRIAQIDFPAIKSKHCESLASQGYRILIDKNAITLEGRTPQGVFYGMQTLVMLLDGKEFLPCGEIIDWPDLAVRGVMVDTARANENLDYYKRVVDFCAHHKINRLHMHLTDDENACLYHEDFTQIMHPNAWKAEQIAKLVDYAQKRHIDIVPEIESLGHARLFVRHPQYKDILHQTTVDKPAKSWAGTSVPGFTNVLCPASPITVEYLDKMYARAAKNFPFPETHIGYDEVDTTVCARCKAKFGDISHSQWLVQHLLRCYELASRDGRKVALWGDMLLNHRDIIDRVPRKGTVIYDWHYRPDTTDESVKFFTGLGFEVIACPALVCHPHMVAPSDYNYKNIQRFAQIARDNDLTGIDTTIWTPVRYMSDVLWPGIAYAAAHSWAGSTWDETAFYRQFAGDFYGLPDGERFGKTWSGFYHMRWWLDKFQVSCWHDEKGLLAAQEKAAGSWGAEARRQLKELQRIQSELKEIGKDVRRNDLPWRTLVRSVDVGVYVRQHLLASEKAKPDGKWDLELIRELDKVCLEQINWIEEDWARNRFAGDPYMDDLNNTRQHLLDSYRKMHVFHKSILGNN